jgi:MFS family permease
LTAYGAGKEDSSSGQTKLSRYTIKALAASITGYAVDGFDFLILGFILSAISADLNLTVNQAASLATGTLIGAALGGFVFGVLADRYGRVRVLRWTIIIFAIFTGLCAFAQTYIDLLAYRTLAGMGLGGEFGIGMALATEAAPAEKRARVTSYVGLGWQAGVLAAALVTTLLLPTIGWRGIFAIGILPAALAFVVRRFVGEPQLFLENQTYFSGDFRLSLLIKDWSTIRIGIAIFILCSVQNFGYYGIMIWLPGYLGKQFGYSLTQSSSWVAVVVLGMVIGIWLFGQLADHFGRRPVFFTCQAGAALSVLVYSQLSNPTALLLAGAIMGMFVNGMIGGYGALISELYPTAVRASAQNILFNLGRAVGGFGPLAVGSLASHYSFSISIGLLSSLYVLDLFVTAFLIPERKGYELE